MKEHFFMSVIVSIDENAFHSLKHARKRNDQEPGGYA